MKKIFLVIGLTLMLIALSGCSKETELNKATGNDPFHEKILTETIITETVLSENYIN